MYSAGKRDSTWFPKYSPAPHFHALEAIFFFRTAMINLSHRPLEIGSSRNCFICLDRKDQGLIGLNTYMRTTPFGVEITNCGPKGSTWVDHAPMDTFQRRTLTNRATIRIGNEYGLLAFKDGYRSIIEYNKFGVPIIHPRVYEIASEDHRKLTLTESEYFRKALELYQMQMDKQVPNETDRCVTMFFQTGAKFNVKIRQIITFGAIGTLQTISSSIRRI